METVRSFCRICTSVCGILVDVDGDEVIQVHGDKEHPFSKGYTCLKGRSLPQLHHHPDRLERPQMRRDGQLQDTTWDTCLNDLASKLKDVIDKHGPQSVAIYFSTMESAGFRMAEALHAAIGTPAKFSPLTIDGTAKPLVSDLVGGFMGLSGRTDLDNADFLILIGVNPVVSHGHAISMPNPTGTIRDIAKRGQVWVIDPRFTETAKLATGHLAPRPSTDHAVLAYLVREILRDGMKTEVPVQCLDELRAAVEPFTLDHTADLADVPQEDLKRLCEAVRGAKCVAVETGTGVTMTAERGNVTQWLAWVLMILTGAMNRPGGTWFHPGFAYQLEAFGEFLPVTPIEGNFGPGPRSRPEAQAFINEWPCAVLPDEVAAGNIRALINVGGSLITSFPETGKLIPALQALEVFATTEIINNETTQLATHVLPTKDPLERPDITLHDILSARVSVQYTPAVVAPVGDRRSMWWVFAELGRRMGLDMGTLGDPDTSTDDDVLAVLLAGARCAFADVVTNGWAESPQDLPAKWVEDHIGRMGGWRLAPPLLVDQLAALEPPAPLVMVPRRQRTKLNGQLDYLGAPPEIQINPADGAAAGVIDGNPVTVRSAVGELTGIAKLDDTIRLGAVAIPHGHHAANVNRLTSKDDIDVVTGMVRYSGIPVSLHPA
ncbi:molybdopterin-dependent oxidoreductase [Mycobacterium sp. OTB74]|jgi:anaerobic selenocysteine-containing dehydrogenase|uniref:molybdopterin-containing oxidoreductase family protein n=1 Tax=Mycobacterium sp. OTB74 TaxID=1853452 RepID=UPI0024759ED8|nr:molybdopterin-dependent oxidoreductase [Mycobacterium sp. OTB74]MDH6246987.1 anaerobic selenocysteine-containing dehydrogenase [Mycobacterium sp. OTB74]